MERSTEVGSGRTLNLTLNIIKAMGTTTGTSETN